MRYYKADTHKSVYYDLIHQNRVFMKKFIDVDEFVKMRQDDITRLVNTALNRAGDVVRQKVAAGDINATMQDVLPLLLYEVLVTNTVATLRLAAEMINLEYADGSGGPDN